MVQTFDGGHGLGSKPSHHRYGCEMSDMYSLRDSVLSNDIHVQRNKIISIFPEETRSKSHLSKLDLVLENAVLSPVLQYKDHRVDHMSSNQINLLLKKQTLETLGKF